MGGILHGCVGGMLHGCVGGMLHGCMGGLKCLQIMWKIMGGGEDHSGPLKVGWRGLGGALM